jgi:hypothetical protein
LLLAASGCGSPPDLGPDEGITKAVDGLMTAVAAKRIDMLDRAAGRLVEMRDKGELGAEGYEYLTATVGRARGGDWAGAMDQLKRLVRGQPKRNSL